MPLFDLGSPRGALSLSLRVSAPGRSGAPVGWYLDADDNRLAHGQQLVVDSEDPIEDWEAVGEEENVG